MDWDKIGEEEIGNKQLVRWDDIEDKPDLSIDWEEIKNKPNSMPANGGNADTIDNKTLRELVVTYKETFWVDGDAETYYPVVFKGVTGSDFFGGQLLYVYRGYSESAPPWNTAVHKGGLDVKIETFLNGWGGLLYYMDILLGQTYTNVIANIEVASPDTNTIIMWLRGGHAIYHVESTSPRLDVNAYIGDYKHLEGGQYERIYSPTKTIEDNFKRISSRRRFSCGYDVFATTDFRFPKNASKVY